MIEQKIEKLIEEAILQKISDKIKRIIEKIKPIPSNILEDIKRKYKAKTSKKLEEAAHIPVKKIQGDISVYDTCYTAIMKLIDQEKKLKKYPDLRTFMEAYHKKIPNPPTTDQVKVQNLKPGTIIFMKYKDPPTAMVNTGFHKFGITQSEVQGIGHMMLYLGEDPSKGKKKYVSLHNSYLGDDRSVPGSGLELKLEYDSKERYNKKFGSISLEILDYNILKNL
jgi:hypothetical protein